MFLVAEQHIFLNSAEKSPGHVLFICYFWRNSWPDFYCTVFYHCNTWVWTCFW